MATTSSKAMNEDRNANRSTSGITDASSPLKEKMGEMVREGARENLQAIKEQANERVADLKGRFGELTSQYRETAKEYADNVNSYVRENPFYALAIGFGAGIFLGALISPRRYFS